MILDIVYKNNDFRYYVYKTMILDIMYIKQ